MNSIKILLILGIIPLLISCDNVIISTPQPIDAKNKYSFPGDFRGVWTTDGDTIIIGKDYYKNIKYREEKVFKQEIDTSSSYVLKENKIYIIDKVKSEISEGFPVKIENDTIYYKERRVYEIALGKKAFLRKVKKNYILNFREEKQWWQVILIRKDRTGNIIVANLTNDMVYEFSNYKHIHTFSSKYGDWDYIEANWTKKELLEMINKGVFSDTIFILKWDKSVE